MYKKHKQLLFVLHFVLFECKRFSVTLYFIVCNRVTICRNPPNLTVEITSVPSKTSGGMTTLHLTLDKPYIRQVYPVFFFIIL